MRSIHHPPERLAAELRAEHPQASDRTLAHMRQKAILRILEDQAPSIIPRIRQKLQRWRLYEAEQ
eukprot:15096691-Alexandrium_andersonii.AAC.1